MLPHLRRGPTGSALAVFLKSHLRDPPSQFVLSTPAACLAARDVLGVMPVPCSELCGAVLRGLSSLSLHADALGFYAALRSKGVLLPITSVPSLVKSCALAPCLVLGLQVHAHALILGIGGNVYLRTALVDFYCKSGALTLAQRLFEEPPGNDPITVNSLITGYSRAGDVESARRLFDTMGRRTSSSWNSMIASYAHRGDFREALDLFELMQANGARANTITVATVLSICAKVGDLRTGLRVRDLISEDALKDMVVRTALMEMYAKCGAIAEARQEFDRLERKDVVAWTSMIAGYAQNRMPGEAVELFERMRDAGCAPNEVTLASVLSACGQLRSVDTGDQIGSYVEGGGLAFGVHVGSALVDMYAKCGHIGRARAVFDKMERRDTVTWNSMIGGLAISGLAEEAINIFEKMKRDNFRLTGATFTNVLTACTHAGLVDKGLSIFWSMKSVHGVAPTVEHCACVVDLLCKAGRVDDAHRFISMMKVKPNAVIWGALLSGCRVQRHVDLAEIAADQLFILEPENSSNYVLMSSIYAGARRWKDAGRVMEMMRRKSVPKQGAASCIEMDGAMRHPRRAQPAGALHLADSEWSDWNSSPC